MFGKKDIERYFNGEKAESILFAATGIVSVAVAIIFLFLIDGLFYKGAALPLFLLGIILTIVGIHVYRKSDSDRARNVNALEMNPAELQNLELPRMKKVMRNFVVLRITEIILALAGIGIFIYFRKNPAMAWWNGFGIALAVMAVTALCADYFAEKRGHEYTSGLESMFVKSN